MPGFQHHKYIFQSVQSPRWASVHVCSGSQAPSTLWFQVLSLHPAEGDERVWDVEGQTGVFITESGNGIWHFHHILVRTQSTPNCRKVWKCNLAVAQDGGQRFGWTHRSFSHRHRGLFIQDKPSPGEKLEGFFFFFFRNLYGHLCFSGLVHWG